MRQASLHKHAHNSVRKKQAISAAVGFLLFDSAQQGLTFSGAGGHWSSLQNTPVIPAVLHNSNLIQAPIGHDLGKSHGSVLLQNQSGQSFNSLSAFSAAAGHQSKTSSNTQSALPQIKHALLNTGTYEVGKSGHILDLDLTSTAADIVLGSKLFGSHASVTIEEDGAPKTLVAGSVVTAAQYVAVQQVLVDGKQGISLASQGTATGGTFSLNAVDKNGLAELVIPKNVTALDLASRNSVIRLSGDLNNYGSIDVVSSSTKQIAASISALDITNETGGSVTSTMLNDSLSLNLVAANNISNSGTISNAGNVNLLTSSGNLTNTGTILSTHQNINISTPNIANDININASGGTFNASAGNIDVRDASYNGSANINLSGGNYLSQNLNLNSGNGVITGIVGQVSGNLNSNAAVEHLAADTANLNLGNNKVSGDPTFASFGSITITGVNTFGEDVAILAEGNISSKGTDASIVDNGHNVTLIAGAPITVNGSVNTNPTTPLTAATNLSGATGTGNGTGNFSATVDFSAPTGGSILLNSGTDAKIIDTSSSGSAGNVTLVAVAQGSTGGQIHINSNALIDASSNAGNGGNVLVLGGVNSTQVTSVILGDVNTSAASGTGGNVGIYTQAPTSSQVVFNQSGSITSGTITASGVTIANASMTLGNINTGLSSLSNSSNVVTSAGNVTLVASANVTAQSLTAAGGTASANMQFSPAPAGGNGGQIQVTSVNGAVNVGSVNTSGGGGAGGVGNGFLPPVQGPTAGGSAGNVTISAAGAITVVGQILALSGGDGGSGGGGDTSNAGGGGGGGGSFASPGIGGQGGPSASGGQSGSITTGVGGAGGAGNGSGGAGANGTNAGFSASATNGTVTLTSGQGVSVQAVSGLSIAAGNLQVTLGGSAINPIYLNNADYSSTQRMYSGAVVTQPLVATGAIGVVGGNITINGSAQAKSLSAGTYYANSSQTISITEGGATVVVGNNTLITPAEYVALEQVANEGGQLLTLNSSGAATGGSLTVNAGNIPLTNFTNLDIPANVTMTVAASVPTIIYTGNVINDGTLTFNAASAQLNAGGVVSLGTNLNFGGVQGGAIVAVGTISSSLLSLTAQQGSTVTLVSSADILFNYNPYTSHIGNLNLIAGAGISPTLDNQTFTSGSLTGGSVDIGQLSTNGGNLVIVAYDGSGAGSMFTPGTIQYGNITTGSNTAGVANGNVTMIAGAASGTAIFNSTGQLSTAGLATTGNSGSVTLLAALPVITLGSAQITAGQLNVQPVFSTGQPTLTDASIDVGNINTQGNKGVSADGSSGVDGGAVIVNAGGDISVKSVSSYGAGGSGGLSSATTGGAGGSGGNGAPISIISTGGSVNISAGLNSSGGGGGGGGGAGASGGAGGGGGAGGTAATITVSSAGDTNILGDVVAVNGGAGGAGASTTVGALGGGGGGGASLGSPGYGGAAPSGVAAGNVGTGQSGGAGGIGHPSGSATHGSSGAGISAGANIALTGLTVEVAGVQNYAVYGGNVAINSAPAYLAPVYLADADYSSSANIYTANITSAPVTVSGLNVVSINNNLTINGLTQSSTLTPNTYTVAAISPAIISENGTNVSVAAGAKVTPAEYVAIIQETNSGSQSLVLTGTGSGTGVASGGSLNIDAINVPTGGFTNLNIPAGATAQVSVANLNYSGTVEIDGAIHFSAPSAQLNVGSTTTVNGTLTFDGAQGGALVSAGSITFNSDAATGTVSGATISYISSASISLNNGLNSPVPVDYVIVAGALLAPAVPANSVTISGASVSGGNISAGNNISTAGGSLQIAAFSAATNTGQINLQAVSTSIIAGSGSGGDITMFAGGAAGDVIQAQTVTTSALGVFGNGGSLTIVNAQPLIAGGSLSVSGGVLDKTSIFDTNIGALGTGAIVVSGITTRGITGASGTAYSGQDGVAGGTGGNVTIEGGELVISSIMSYGGGGGGGASSGSSGAGGNGGIGGAGGNINLTSTQSIFIFQAVNASGGGGGGGGGSADQPGGIGGVGGASGNVTMISSTASGTNQINGVISAVAGAGGGAGGAGTGPGSTGLGGGGGASAGSAGKVGLDTSGGTVAGQSGQTIGQGNAAGGTVTLIGVGNQLNGNGTSIVASGVGGSINIINSATGTINANYTQNADYSSSSRSENAPTLSGSNPFIINPTRSGQSGSNGALVADTVFINGEASSGAVSSTVYSNTVMPIVEQGGVLIVSSGSALTPAEYVALVQTREGNQTLILNGSASTGGAAVGGSLSIAQANLPGSGFTTFNLPASVTANVSATGFTASQNIVVNGALIFGGAGSLSGQNISGTGTVTITGANALTLVASNGDIGSAQQSLFVTNSLGSLQLNASGNNVYISSDKNVALVNDNSASTATGTFDLTTGGNISQTKANLLAISSGDLLLTSTNGDVGSVANTSPINIESSGTSTVSAIGEINLAYTGAATLGNFTAGGNLSVASDNNISVGANVLGNNITLTSTSKTGTITFGSSAFAEAQNLISISAPLSVVAQSDGMGISSATISGQSVHITTAAVDNQGLIQSGGNTGDATIVSNPIGGLTLTSTGSWVNPVSLQLQATNGTLDLGSLFSTNQLTSAANISLTVIGTTGGGININSDQIAASLTSNGDGGSVVISAKSLTNAAGPLLVSASGLGNGGSVNIVLSGSNAVIIDSADLSISADGTLGNAGVVRVATGGNLTVDPSALSMLAGGGNGGTLALTAGTSGTGTLALQANLSVNGTSGGNGGEIDLKAPLITYTNTLSLSANGDNTGNGGTISYISAGTTAVNLDTSTSAANAIAISDQSGANVGNGGSTTVHNGGGITLNAISDGSGINGNGANLSLVSAATVTLTSATLNKDGNGSGSGGTIDLEAKFIAYPGSGTSPLILSANSGPSGASGGSVTYSTLSTSPLVVGKAAGNIELSATSAGTTGGALTVSNGGNLTVNTAQLNLTSAGNGGSISLVAGAAASGNLVVIGDLSAAGAKLTGEGGSINLASNSKTAFSIGATKALNGTQGTINLYGLNTYGRLTVTNSGAGGIVQAQALTASNVTYTTAGPIAINNNLGLNNSVIVLSTTTAAKITSGAKALITGDIKAISQGGAIALADVGSGSVDAETSGKGTVAITNPTGDFFITKAVGSSVTVKTAGPITVDGPITAGNVTIQGTAKNGAVMNINGSITSTGTVAITNASTLTQANTSSIQATKAITVTAGSSSNSSLSFSGNLQTAAAGTISITNAKSTLISAISDSGDISGAKTVTIGAPLGGVSINTIGSVVAPGAVSITANSALSTQHNIVAINSIALKAAGLGTSFMISGNLETTATGKTPVGTISLTATANGGVINTFGDIGAGKSVTLVATKGSINQVGTIGGGSLVPTTVTETALTSITSGATKAVTTVAIKTTASNVQSSLEVGDITTTGVAGVVTLTNAGSIALGSGIYALGTVTGTKSVTIAQTKGTVQTDNIIGGVVKITAADELLSNGGISGSSVTLATTANNLADKGAILLNDVTATNGVISVIAAGGNLVASNGATIAANATGAAKATITLENKDTLAGAITIDAGANIVNFGGAGTNVNIVIGAPPGSPAAGVLTVNPGLTFNGSTTRPTSGFYFGTTAGVNLVYNSNSPISLNNAGGGKVIFNIVPVKNSTATITVNGSTDSNYPTYIKADPPVSMATSSSLDLDSRLESHLTLNNTAPAAESLVAASALTPVQGLNLVSGNKDALSVSALQNPLALQGSVVEAVDSSNYPGGRSSAYGVPAETLYLGTSSNGGNGGLIDAKLVDSILTDAGKELELQTGNIVVAPNQAMSVITKYGKVNVAEKSVVLIMSLPHGTAVFNLDDTRKDAVVIEIGQSKVSVAPGRHTLVTHDNVSDFGVVNAAQNFAFRNVSSQKCAHGLQAFTAEFSVVHALSGVNALRQMLIADAPDTRKSAQHMIKTAAIVSQLTSGRNNAGSGQSYQLYQHPRLTASAVTR